MRRAALPPVDGSGPGRNGLYCELWVDTGAPAESPELVGGAVVLVDRAIGDVGVGSAAAVVVKGSGQLINERDQARLVIAGDGLAGRASLLACRRAHPFTVSP